MITLTVIIFTAITAVNINDYTQIPIFILCLLIEALIIPIYCLILFINLEQFPTQEFDFNKLPI